MERYPWNLALRLASRIENCQTQQAHKDLDKTISLITTRYRQALAVRKLLCAQIITQCLRGAHAAGGPSQLLLSEHQQILLRLASRRTWKLTQEVMHEYIDLLILRVRPQRTPDIQRFIKWMLKDIKNSIADPKSLAQYAEHGGISTGHLSRTFAAQTGQTFRESLRQTRTALAKRLLVNTQLKISVVAHQVGLKDASQFIHYFRLETDMTPGQYRLANRRRSFGGGSAEFASV